MSANNNNQNNNFNLSDNPNPYVGVPRPAEDVNDTGSAYFRHIASGFSDDPLPWELEDYCNGPYYDGRRFASISNARGLQVYAAYGDRQRALKHRSGVVHDDLTVMEDEPIWSDMPTARNASECEYQRRLYELLQRMRSDFQERQPLLPAGRTLLSLSVLPHPVDRFYLLNRRSEAIRRDVTFEARMRRTNRLFVGYHNVEFHRIPQYDRGRLYLSCNLAYYTEVPAALQVPTPPAVAYMSGVLDSENDADMAVRWWQVIAAEWAELVFHRVMCTAKYGADNASGIVDRRFTGTLDSPAPRGRILSLPRALLTTWMQMGIANLAYGTEFSEEDVFGVIRTTVMTDWARVPGFIYYDFQSRTFAPMWSEARYGQTDADSIREWPRLAAEPEWFAPFRTMVVLAYARGATPFSEVPLLLAPGDTEDELMLSARTTPVETTPEAETHATTEERQGEQENGEEPRGEGDGEEPEGEREAETTEAGEGVTPTPGGTKRRHSEMGATETSNLQLGERREASVGQEDAPGNTGSGGVTGKLRGFGTRFRTAMDAVRDKVLTSGSGNASAVATTTAAAETAGVPETSADDTPIEVINVDGSSSGSVQPPPTKARRVDKRAARLPDLELEPDSGLTSSQYAPDVGVFNEEALLTTGRSATFSSGANGGILATPFAAISGERELNTEVSQGDREAAFHSLRRVFGSHREYTHTEIYRVIPLLCQRLVMAQEALALGREQQMRLIRLQERMADLPPPTSNTVRSTLSRGSAFLMPQVTNTGGSVRTTRLASDNNLTVVARPQVPIADGVEEFDWEALDEDDE